MALKKSLVRRMAAAGALGVMAICAPAGVGAASADPAAPGDDQVAVPLSPMPVPEGSYGYLATRKATLWLASLEPADRIASMPAPPDYAKSNRALAQQMDRELGGAVKTPGACVQVIIGPASSGGLFEYGVWAVDRQYCPK